ncbi:MAG: PspA/IM30 family protein, partial [Gammaproteobacteria bacterium]|nr:PspA/IM30 family protein [Gammaproteobacteria bacterium]
SAELATTDEHIEQLNQEIAKLQSKLNDAKAKKKALVMRSKTVESRIKVKRQVNRDALDEAFNRFEHFERRMDNLESQLEVLDMGKDVAPSLAAEISALEQDEKLNAELERLKAEVDSSKTH